MTTPTSDRPTTSTETSDGARSARRLQRLARALRLLTVGALSCLVVLGASGSMTSRTATQAETVPDVRGTQVARLLEERRCWSGEAPVGAPVPSRAVVTVGVRPPRVVRSAVGFGIWLDGDPGVVHGFCP